MDFKLDKWNIDYAADIAKHANNKNIADKLRNVFPFPYTLQNATDYINFCIANEDNQQICNAITVNGEAVGSIGIFVQNDVYSRNAELGYWLSEQFWGKGIMTEATKQICDEAFETFDIVRIFAEPYAINRGSRRVLEKNGFVLEGIMKKSVFKNGNTYDSCMYALVK